MTDESDQDRVVVPVQDGQPENVEDTEGVEDSGSPPEVKKARREAAKYRRELRELQQARTADLEIMAGLQRVEAERAAAEWMQDGRDLWAGGVQLADMLDDEGRLDPDAVRAAVDGVIAERPHWRRNHGSADAGRGSPTDVSGSGPFGAVLKGR